ncbi:MAG: hypothetical protein ABIT37_22400 [Luteolibacter sp.]
MNTTDTMPPATTGTILHQDTPDSDLPPSDGINITEPETVPRRRETMNRKPVLYREAKTVLTLHSHFLEKRLCDGPTLNLGDACAFSCEYCYVETQMWKVDKPILDAHNSDTNQNLGFGDVTIRRQNAIGLLRSQLVRPDGSNVFDDPNDQRVVYSSTLVDVAANLELLKETAAACILILKDTSWQIRLLSKSPLLAKLITDGMIPEEYHHRLIMGFSVGTLDDRVAKAIERGTGLVSKRIEALHQLQDLGIRTFGMICPSLPQDDYDGFSKEICAAIRPEKCEHVWAEVINVRGKSLTKTLESLRAAGLEAEAARLKAVCGSKTKEAWEQYARDTFLAHAQHIPPGKLRFLQYINSGSAGWWETQIPKGAVLLGKTATAQKMTRTGSSSTVPPYPALSTEDFLYRSAREKIVGDNVKASIAAAGALFEIHSYRGGLLWKRDHPSFEAYCKAMWGYGKAHGYRLLDTGGFIAELEADQSPNGDWLPLNEGQIRPLLDLVPKEHRKECWNGIVEEKAPTELTGATVQAAAKRFLAENGLIARKTEKIRKDPRAQAIAEVEKLRTFLSKLPCPEKFEQLLLGISLLIDQEPTDPVVETVADQVESSMEPLHDTP